MYLLYVASNTCSYSHETVFRHKFRPVRRKAYAFMHITDILVERVSLHIFF